MRLLSYFSDICHHLLDLSKNCLNKKLKNDKGAFDKEPTLKILFEYVNLRLLLENFCKPSLLGNNDYLNWYENHRKDCVTEGMELISLIGSTKINTRENTFDLFNQVKKRYKDNLGEIIIVNGR
jgi:hypothetical protein